MIKSKRGSVLDIFLIIVILLIGCVTLVIGNNMFSEVFPKVDEHINESAEAHQVIEKATESLNTFDAVFVAIFVGLIIFLILSSFLVNIHPAFIIISIIISIIAVVVAVPISNFYQLMIEKVGNESAFTMTGFIMENLPYLTAVICGIALVIMYGKIRSGGAR